MPSPPNDGEDQGASPVNGPSVGSYQSSGKRKMHTKKKKGTITANVAGTKYEIVRIVINEMDFLKTRDEDETANLIWNDSAVQHEKIAELRNYQRINHFPGMGEICRKDCLARNMSNSHLSEGGVMNVFQRKEENRNRDLIRLFDSIESSVQCIPLYAEDRAPLRPTRKQDQSGPNEPLQAPKTPRSDFLKEKVLNILSMFLLSLLWQINRAPSFGTDQKIDYDVKKGVLLNALKLLNIRASDKKRNLAQQKAEAQRRLYGHRSMKKLSAASSDWEKQRHTLERRREELKERLAQVRKQISREEHEKQHLGNYRRIYPPDDKLLLEKYESLLSAAFQTFLAGRAASLQKEMNNPLKRMKEEDILDLLEQCELDDEKLMGKSSRQRGPKPLTAMPECSQTPRRQRPDYLADFSSGSSADNSCTSSDEEEEEKRKAGGGRGGEKRGEKKVSYDLGETKEKNLAERSGRMHLKPPIKSLKAGAAPTASPTLSGPIRRSISCPRSIASLSSPSEVRAPPARPSPAVPMATPLVRPSSATLRSHSLSRSGSAHRVPHSNSLGTIHSNIGEPLINLRSKEQEAELVRQTLAVLTAMRIRFPGKTEEEAEAVLDEILDNWKYHKPKVASYWLVKLDSTKQRKVLDIVRTNVRSALQRIWREPDVESLHLYRLFNRVFNRLLWSHGQGLWNCFSNTGSSWETIFSKSSEVVSPQELQCCRRLVQLCRDCLLVVYKFVSESRGSLTGLSPEWDDTRYLLPVTSQFIMKWPSSSFGRLSSAVPRSRSLFAARMGHF
ncbi:tubulin polyglutamylase TTLL7 [Amphiprion ocellaris]|uniref:tubulin polyglutamylase TTLL7 n=1 Tax=Amphiprion ocellaris TaxID=80972 RepID=UPI0024117375|nr:tubulin polyglutamylase TTLL7 [Amphiprion ocellaris]